MSIPGQFPCIVWGWGSGGVIDRCITFELRNTAATNPEVIHGYNMLHVSQGGPNQRCGFESRIDK